MVDRPTDLTRLLQAWSEGDPQAMDRLMPLVHAELERLAHRYMSAERSEHTLETGALVNEAYLRLVDQRHVRWQSRAHFFGIAATLMRRILVDHARRRRQQKRGAGGRPVPLEDVAILSSTRGEAVLALDEALDRLVAIDARKAKIVELRYFGGLTAEEIGGLLGLSSVTVMREGRLARAWLRRELGDER